ncbi:MAG: type II toxin-antitoxin system VapC family toxin [Chloroflexi bacterium]|nr:type II toxin-antitoxin system VapC family toxin [Chloroflexota bacterium]
MTRYVIDASVAVEYLLKTPVGLALADLIERAGLIAPELLDAEVLSALRRAVLGGRLEEARALEALDDLTDWPLERIPNRTLARLAWRHLHNVSAYDAFYIAAAHAYDATLLTADGRLSRTSQPGIVIQHIQMG